MPQRTPDDPTSAAGRVWRIAVVEDHALQRQRTREILGREPDLSVVATCATLPEFLAWLGRTRRRERPHLLILDLSVDRGPAADPRSVARLTRAGLRVLVLSALTSVSQVRAAIHAGVVGVVAKTDPEQVVVQAVGAALRGEEWITPELAAVMAGDGRRPRLSVQEERLLQFYASGLTLPDVAAQLGVRTDTAKTYLSRIKAKYAALDRPVSTKLDLRRAAVEDGYLDDFSVRCS